MKVLVIDYGMGNLGSVRRALEECGAEVLVTGKPDDLAGFDRIILPGVGAFGEGMANLVEGGWPARIKQVLQDPHVTLLGICLGMQLLADRGHEGGVNPGLGLIAGEVRRLEPDSGDTRLPHVGWNQVHYRSANSLFNLIPNDSDFYFVHSYHLIPAASENIVATTPYCGGFVSAVAAGNMRGVQFHPEKSGRVGLQLLRSYLEAGSC
jgi:glutamine amidotransferase